MNDIFDISEHNRFLKRIESSDIKIDKGEIFYRDKYNDIINYFKLMMTTSEELEIYNYIKPKGTLLINAPSGTDILDYIKLISNNYYLDFIELDTTEIIKAPNDFINVFNKILEDFNSEVKINEENKSKKNNNKILILINQSKNLKKILDGESLFNTFMNYWRDRFMDISYKENNKILVWVTNEYQEFINNSEDIYKVFDLFINIPILNKIERETILRDFAEKNTRISFDINTVVTYTKNWEVLNLKQLLKVAILKHFLNSDLNETSNEITDIIVKLIESGEFIPSFLPDHLRTKELMGNHKEKSIITEISDDNEDFLLNMAGIDDIINRIQKQGYSEFMLSQLYEDAASRNYSEILLIIDKLKKKEPIEENDRKLLAQYPFILNDNPSRAQLNLEKAKKRVDLIKLAFGKD
ncbi:MAG: hypothetical protein ACFFBP_04730 [Promethearchaeota archaeon]